MRRRRIWVVFTLLALAYVGSYLGFRKSHTEIWKNDGKAYVIFPRNSSALYFAFRPITYLDGALTGMRFHIGPHR